MRHKCRSLRFLASTPQRALQVLLHAPPAPSILLPLLRQLLHAYHAPRDHSAIVRASLRLLDPAQLATGAAVEHRPRRLLSVRLGPGAVVAAPHQCPVFPAPSSMQVVPHPPKPVCPALRDSSVRLLAPHHPVALLLLAATHLAVQQNLARCKLRQERTHPLEPAAPRPARQEPMRIHTGLKPAIFALRGGTAQQAQRRPCSARPATFAQQARPPRCSGHAPSPHFPTSVALPQQLAAHHAEPVRTVRLPG